MRESKQPRTSRGDVPSEPLSLERIENQYNGQWVLVKITAFNEYHTPIEGRVIAHGTRKRINKTLTEVASPGQSPDAHYYVFSAGAFIRPGAEAMRHLIESSPQESRDASGQR
jgi:hypothetical protein